MVKFIARPKGNAVPTYKTEGIILRRVNFAEADRILTILTPQHGKVSAIAKGMRRIGSKLGPHLDIFSEIQLMLASGKSLDVVTSAQQLKRFDVITGNYEAMRMGFLACEMVDKLTDKHTSSTIYKLLLQTLSLLNQSKNLPVVELYFKLQLLDLLGYKPNLEQCMVSLDEIEAGKHYFFSSEKGGFIERRHGNGHEPKITTEHIKLWRMVFDYPPEKLVSIKGSDQAASETLPVLDDFYNYLFGKRFRSAEI